MHPTLESCSVHQACILCLVNLVKLANGPLVNLTSYFPFPVTGAAASAKFVLFPGRKRTSSKDCTNHPWLTQEPHKLRLKTLKKDNLQKYIAKRKLQVSLLVASRSSKLPSLYFNYQYSSTFLAVHVHSLRPSLPP